MDYRYNDWKYITCVTDLRKRHKGQNLQCPKEDDLLSKSVIKEIVLRIVFYINN